MNEKLNALAAKLSQLADTATAVALRHGELAVCCPASGATMTDNKGEFMKNYGRADAFREAAKLVGELASPEG